MKDCVDTVTPAKENDLSAQIKAIASRLTDIAGCVATEAEAATAIVRDTSAQAHRVAALAAALADAAAVIEESADYQAVILAQARASIAIRKPVIEALTRSAAGVASVSAKVSDIARESRVVSLNARIEAARSGSTGHAFAVVASEMSALTVRTKDATDDIAARASAIARDIGTADEIVAAHEALAAEQDAVLFSSLSQARRQREAAAQLVMITAETAETVNRTAAAIGRVGANAVAAKMLARQLAKLVPAATG